MKNIILMCSTGASTSVLCKRMREAAETMGYECTVNAVGVTRLEEVADQADIILVGPQIRFQAKRIRETASCPVLDIDMRIYGAMDGKAMMEIVRKELG